MAIPGLAACRGREATPAAHAEEAGSDRPEDAATKLLTAKYPAPVRRADGFLTVTIRPFFEPGTVIRELRLESLEARMPSTRFFLTTMRSRSEFPEVATVVAVVRSANGSWRGVQEGLSPLFSDPSGDFLSLFRGIATASDAERERIGGDITRIFEEITLAGSIRRARLEARRFRCELWAGDLPYRSISVTYDRDGKVEDVMLAPPSDDMKDLGVLTLPASSDRTPPK